METPRPSSPKPSTIGYSQRFRESVHLIPTPDVDIKRPKRFEPIILKPWVIVSLATLMIALAIVLEVVLYLSQKNNGFHVPERNVFTFVSSQFLTSFFPVLLFGPLAILWGVTDWMLRWYQPYLTLSNGFAPAEDSLLLDYIALNKISTVFYSFRHGHWLLCVSSLTALGALIMQPLASSVLEIGQAYETQSSQVVNVQAIGLSPDVSDLQGFAAAAGFTAAAVHSNLDDPPFVRGGWAVAEFVFPNDPMLNGSMAINTVGLEVTPNCELPTSLTLAAANSTAGGNGTLLALSATSDDGCTGTQTFDPATASGQYGVIGVPGCGAATDQTFEPVMFWYWYTGQNNTGQGTGRAVFCTPTLQLYNLVASASLNNGSLVGVNVLNNFNQTNNVTGAPLSGQVFNGLVFDNSTDPFVQARALTISSSVSGAMFLQATQQGLNSVFEDTVGFLNITQSVYTQYLAVAATSTYFVPESWKSAAELTQLVPRLFIHTFSTHALALSLLLIGLSGIVVHIIHARQRRELYLTAPPGSIAAIVSLTSRSGFGELLLPYDDERAMREKLSGLRFRLDKRTGAIVAEDEEEVGYTGYRDGYHQPGVERESSFLMSSQHSRVPSSAGSKTLSGFSTAVDEPPKIQDDS